MVQDTTQSLLNQNGVCILFTPTFYPIAHIIFLVQAWGTQCQLLIIACLIAMFYLVSTMSASIAATSQAFPEHAELHIGGVFFEPYFSDCSRFLLAYILFSLGRLHQGAIQAVYP